MTIHIILSVFCIERFKVQHTSRPDLPFCSNQIPLTKQQSAVDSAKLLRGQV
jgi:hypothetical protein